jgi:glycosyltransferase involved in cell wall biosynthesis
MLGQTKINIIDSLVLKDALKYINFQVTNFGLIHQIDRDIEAYNNLPLIVTGEAAKHDLVLNFEVSENNIHVVKPGIDLNWKVKTTYSDGVRNLLSVSNFIDGKGIDILIKALMELQDYNWHLKIAGNDQLDPQYFQSIQNLLEASGMKDRIDLIGVLSRAEINQLMIEADMLIQCSENETYGMAVQEAVQSRLPVLMYKTGAWEEFKASGFVRIIEDYSLPSFKESLHYIFDNGLDKDMFRAKAITSKRTWEEVSREIEFILLNN